MDRFTNMERFKEFLGRQAQSLRPSIFSKHPHFNFITAHYIWVVSMSIVGSVLIYGAGRGELAYIDSLVFASGGNTQAGLNPVDVNLLNTFQQVVIFFLAMMSNPMTINSFVVFLRLYWFEKRFQNIVREARLRRGTISKSKSKSKGGEPSRLENGVNGRNITVMHNGAKARITNDGILLDEAGPQANGNAESAPEPYEHRRQDTIKFADMVKRSDGLDDELAKLPPLRPDDDHIAILERQRAGNDEVLRIPGPRDAERGMLPERVRGRGSNDDELDPLDPLSHVRSGESTDTAGPAQPPGTAVGGRQQTIKIEEPQRPNRDAHEALDDIVDDARAAAKTLSLLRLRKPRILDKSDQKLHHSDNNLHVAPSNTRRKTFEKIRTAFSSNKQEEDQAPYLSWEPTLGRNSQFPDLTEEQREELGGIEYRSLKTLALILVCYFWGFWIFGVLCLLPWLLRSPYYAGIVDAAGQSRAWWGIFTSHSAFMDLGFTLTPDSMNSFNMATWPLLVMSFLIVIGNTGFPVMLRFIIWVSSIVVPRGSGVWEELKFLLDHPRRCFTLLFPSGATWWLFWLLVLLNGIDLIFFIILDLGSGPVVELPPGYRVLDGLFQAASTRTAGFSVINLAALHPGVQTSYMIMMYISVFPIAISVRRTNVYEEKSLGIYGGNEAEENSDANDMSYVGAHLRRQLSFDLWYIFVGFFILSISEGGRLMRGDFSMFAVLFEIVSAYGTVGMSLGYTGINASLCSQFSVVGKLVIIGMQIRGRHRGLPYGLDRAILLPSESLNDKEAADADARQFARRNSAVSGVTSATRGGASINRTRSRSVDRVNSNLFAAILHPGPPVTKAPQRRRSMSSGDESPYATRTYSARVEPTFSQPFQTGRASADGARSVA
ncbi:potassium transport protein TRK1/TRK2 [Coniochaeta ligniaria NRRL 30616]|uniref:Potassium transport protein n=1 Tax=Coniochaeta ligniaria NRRL 30616 TaxID=1408157 RepID=A0A1J7JXA6_9PEZI|nr:potassium transport protein TRK1/TRK2 [Coniochaeta ligniaria NRRL 30616]